MSILKSSALFAGGTLISRLFGIVRESVVAGVFGASLALDSFLVANRIPNMLREMLAEGALGSSFTKVFAELWERERPRAMALLRDSFYVCTLLALVVCGLGIVAAPWLVDAMTMMSAGRPESQLFQEQTIGLTRLLFPFIGFMIVGAIASGALHQRGRFFTSAASPIALNLGYLVGALVFAELLARFAPASLDQSLAERRIVGLALGVLLGGLMQLAVQVYAIWKPYIREFKHLGPVQLLSPDVRRVFLLMGPMVIASSAGQINVLVNTNFSTSLETGAVAWLTFSFRILQLPIGLFAVAIGSVALPRLTRAVVASRLTPQGPALVGAELSQALEWMLWLMVPCCCFFLASALPICQLLLQYGAYTAEATLATAAALYYYAFSLIGYGLIKVLTSYYYAVERTRFAMQVSIVSIGINYAANYLLVGTYGHTGLAMTSSLVLTGNAVFLLLGLLRDRLELRSRQLISSAACLALAFAAAYAGQQLALDLLHQASASADLPVKIKACIEVVVNGLTVVVLFLGFGLLRLQKTPASAWILMKNMVKTKRVKSAKGS